ncbi:MAG TPA: ATP-binding protein [Stellaceae bacterium]|nr:ATP-binding protein [Stellaceae bacterium]
MHKETRLFDLNIKKILEAWDSSHAVREIIANALDEQKLTKTRDVTISREADGYWIIRDFGRGLRYEHFTQNENPEKIKNVGQVIGKFGVGLKDALATLHRNGVKVEIESAHCLITLAQQAKHGFGDVVTLHAAVAPPRDRDFAGTAVRFEGLSDQDMEAAKSLFLKFSGDRVIEETRVGQILEKKGKTARIYVAGLLVAEEHNFAFSYDITSLTESMKKALNRERANVGRTAYTERVKSMLLQTRSERVAKTLADELIALERGTASDEVNWKDVAVHACKILNASGRYLFVTASQLAVNANAVDHARGDGIQIVTVPESIHDEVAGARDLTGAPIRDLGVYQGEWNESFKFEWVPIQRMTVQERAVFAQIDTISALVGGVPRQVRAVRVSQTMRQDFLRGTDALGLWDPESASIVIRRDQLRCLELFAGTLLHELAHARTGHTDVTREFEDDLTTLLGITTAAAIKGTPGGPRVKRRFWRR